MKKNNKLPLKRAQMLNSFKANEIRNRVPDSDATTTVTIALTTTHIFNK